MKETCFAFAGFILAMVAMTWTVVQTANDAKHACFESVVAASDIPADSSSQSALHAIRAMSSLRDFLDAYAIGTMLILAAGTVLGFLLACILHGGRPIKCMALLASIVVGLLSAECVLQPLFQNDARDLQYALAITTSATIREAADALNARSDSLFSTFNLGYRSELSTRK